MHKKNLTKKDLVKNLSNETGFSLNLSKKILEDLIFVLIENINSGTLILKNVGSFKLILKNKRIGRNPKTGEEFIITQRKTVKFTPSKKVKDKLSEIV